MHFGIEWDKTFITISLVLNCFRWLFDFASFQLTRSNNFITQNSMTSYLVSGSNLKVENFYKRRWLIRSTLIPVFHNMKRLGVQLPLDEMLVNCRYPPGFLSVWLKIRSYRSHSWVRVKCFVQRKYTTVTPANARTQTSWSQVNPITV